jgi:hypothetical protein
MAILSENKVPSLRRPIILAPPAPLPTCMARAKCSSLCTPFTCSSQGIARSGVIVTRLQYDPLPYNYVLEYRTLREVGGIFQLGFQF